MVRTTRRLATGLKTPWTAVYVETTEGQIQDPKLRQHLRLVLQSAERNGAQLINLHGPRIGDELLAYARANGITKIIIGNPLRPAWRQRFRPNLVDHIIRNSGDIDVYVITAPTAQFSVAHHNKQNSREIIRGYGLALLMVTIITGFGWLVRTHFSGADIVMLYLMGVVLVAAGLGRNPALLYSVASVNAFNFFLVDPVYTFNVYDQSYWLTFLVMLLASFVISNQTLRLRDQAQLSRRRERKTQIFYQLTRSLAAARDRTSICDLVVKHSEDTSGAAAAVWLPDTDGKLALVAGKVVGSSEKETTAAQWCFGSGQAAGSGTNTLPSADGYYLPVRGSENQFGVLGIYALRPDEGFDADTTETLETIASLLASSLERAQAGEDAEQNKMARERERLRNVLLSSVSHDLRTPLAAIAGAADTLAERPQRVSDATALTLIQSVRQEAGQLTRIVKNLLDVTRYEGAGLQLNLQPYLLAEIIGSALEVCRDSLKSHRLETSIPDDLPLIQMDGVLISQALTNLFENAAKHTPAGTQIIIAATRNTEGILFTVSDNGPGIPQGHEKMIFEKFATYQRGDLPKGVGLGLAICQAIVTAHHATLWAENRLQGGSQFNIQFPNETILNQVDEALP